jgi:hypothetical protein
VRRLIALVALLAAFAVAPAAHAETIAPGLSRTDANQIDLLARAHWPQMPCATIPFVRLPGSRMGGRSVALEVHGGCGVVFNSGRRLSAVGWCRVLYGVFKKLAGSSPASAWPYNCTLSVGPRPARPRLISVPGLSAAQVRQAYEVATGHWQSSSCRGREQLHWASNAQLLVGGGTDPGPGAVVMGEALLHDSRCVAYLNASVSGWDAETLCVTLEHEFGHLKGLEHSTDPTNVMYPVNARAADCEKAFPLPGVPTPEPAPTPPAPAPAAPPPPATGVNPGGFGGLGG